MKHNLEKELQALDRSMEQRKVVFYYVNVYGRVSRCEGTQNLDLIPDEAKKKILARSNDPFYIKSGHIIKVLEFYKERLFAYFDYCEEDVFYVHRRRIIPNESYLEDLISYSIIDDI